MTLKEMDLDEITQIVVMPDGSFSKKLNTDILPYVSLEKSKMSSLITPLFLISRQFNLNLSHKKDRDFAMNILNKSVINN